MTNREQKEELLQLSFAEVMHQEFLGIGAYTGDVLVLAFMLPPQVCYPLLHILCHLHQQIACPSMVMSDW